MLLNEVFGDQTSPANLVRTEVDSLVRSISQDAEVDVIVKDYDNQLWLTISLIRLPKNQRRQGIGGRIMSALCEYADRHNIIIALSPSSEFGTSKTALTAFYKKFGFVANSGRNKDYRTRETMIRLPRLTESIFTILMK